MSNPFAPPSSTVIRLDKPSLDGEPVRRWDLSVIGQAATLLQARLGENIGVAMLAFGVSPALWLVGVAVQEVATSGGTGPKVAMLIGQAVSLSGSLLQGYLSIGAARFYLAQVRGQDTSLLEVFRGWPWVLPIVLGNMLVGLASVASIVLLIISMFVLGLGWERWRAFLVDDGGLPIALSNVLVGLASVASVASLPLLFVPMVVLWLGWQFWQYFVVDEDMGAVDALTASWRLTMGSKVDLFVFAFVSFLINYAGLYPFGVGLLVTFPLTGLASMMVYDNLRIVGPKEV